MRWVFVVMLSLVFVVGCESINAVEPYSKGISPVPIFLAPSSETSNIGFAGLDALTKEPLTIEVWVDIKSYGKAYDTGYILFIDIPKGEHKYLVRAEGYEFEAGVFWVKGGEYDVKTILLTKKEAE